MIQYVHGGEVMANNESSTIRKYSALELESGKTFKWEMKEPVKSWLVRLWGIWVDRISLAAVETDNQNNLSLGKGFISSYNRGKSSLMDWLVEPLESPGHLIWGAHKYQGLRTVETDRHYRGTQKQQELYLNPNLFGTYIELCSQRT